MSGVTDKLSGTAFRLRTFRDAVPLGTATGFVFRGADSSSWLVTNYHVLSGYNPLTMQPLHPQGALPNKIKFHLPTYGQTEKGDWFFRYLPREFSLLNNENVPEWRVHPTLGNTVDVALLPLGPEAGVSVWTINDACSDPLFDENIPMRPGIDVYVIGFPLGIAIAKHLALWKRGTIASEPRFDVNDKPLILIDCATRSGMSGSPVIAQVQGVWGGSSTDATTISADTKIGTGRQFIGIYSGRLGEDEFQAQLGLVWKLRVIEEIVGAGQTLDVSMVLATPPAVQ